MNAKQSHHIIKATDSTELTSMEWDRGEAIGRGSFATVNLAIPRKSSAQFLSSTVVKSCDVFCSSSLVNEKQVLDRLGLSPEIIRCFGDDYSFENGKEYYNLFLEYATGGCLADKLNSHGGRLRESDVKRYTRSIIKGLSHIHDKGFVHCDVKLQNVLVFGNGDIKIADFGLAKKAGEKQNNPGNDFEWRGTPMYMSPESVNENEYESPADIWALGCAVVEMLTGRPAWDFQPGSNIYSLLFRIGNGDDLPEIPNEVSEEAKDFLGKCFVKDPRKRWTAEMLLKHPFIGNNTISLKPSDDLVSTSPRCHFDFPDWISSTTASVPSSPDSAKWSEEKLDACFDSSCLSSFSSPADRIQQLVTDQTPDWSASERWVTVR